MCRAWRWLSCVMLGMTGLMATLLVTGLLDFGPMTGVGMGWMAGSAVVSTGCWVHWQGKVSDVD